MVLTFTGTNWLLRNISYWRYAFYKICEIEASGINRDTQQHAALAFSQSFFLIRTTTGESAPRSSEVTMEAFLRTYWWIFIVKIIPRCHTNSITVLFTAHRLGPINTALGATTFRRFPIWSREKLISHCVRLPSENTSSTAAAPPHRPASAGRGRHKSGRSEERSWGGSRRDPAGNGERPCRRARTAMQGCEAGATRQPLLLRALSSLPEPPIQNTFLPFVIAYKQTIEPQIYLRYDRLSPRTAFLESRPFSLTFHGQSRHFSSIFSTAPPKSLRFPPLKGNLSPVTEQHNPGLCFGSAQGCGNPSPELPLGTSPSRLALGFSPASYTLSQLLFSSFPLSSLLRLSEPTLSCSQSRSLSPLPPSLRAALSPFPPSPQLALYPSAPLSARACFALCSRLPCSLLALFPQLAPFPQRCSPPAPAHRSALPAPLSRAPRHPPHPSAQAPPRPTAPPLAQRPGISGLTVLRLAARCRRPNAPHGESAAAAEPAGPLGARGSGALPPERRAVPQRAVPGRLSARWAGWGDGPGRAGPGDAGCCVREQLWRCAPCWARVGCDPWAEGIRAGGEAWENRRERSGGWALRSGGNARRWEMTGGTQYSDGTDSGCWGQ